MSSEDTTLSGVSFVTVFKDDKDLLYKNCDPISYQIREVIQTVFFVMICGFLSFFGIIANTVNIGVFVRQGFKDSINISLLGLAIADLGCALTMFLTSIGYNPVLLSANLNFNPLAVVYVVACWPHAYFNRVTSFITVFITLERCLCVTLPLKVKDIITPFKTKVFIIVIFVAILLLFIPFYCVNFLKWVTSQATNRTILSLVFSENRVLVETVTFSLHSILLPVFSLISVIFLTLVLIFALNRKQKWRQSSTSLSASNQDVTSVREKKVVKMVILISIIFIACYSPATVNFLFTVFEPEFSYTGKFGNLYMVVWSCSALAQTVSFSVNIFVYLSMSSKFRDTLQKSINCISTVASRESDRSPHKLKV